MNPDELESLIHRRLAELPPPRAPQTLAPRVMARIRRRRQSPWFGQPWIAWPRVWQVVSLILFVGLCSSAWLGVEEAVGSSDFYGGTRVGASIIAVTDAVAALADSARILRRVLLEPIAGRLMVVMALVYMVSALLGAALARLIQEREAGR